MQKRHERLLYLIMLISMVVFPAVGAFIAFLRGAPIDEGVLAGLWVLIVGMFLLALGILSGWFRPRHRDVVKSCGESGVEDDPWHVEPVESSDPDEGLVEEARVAVDLLALTVGSGQRDLEFDEDVLTEGTTSALIVGLGEARALLSAWGRRRQMTATEMQEYLDLVRSRQVDLDDLGTVVKVERALAGPFLEDQISAGIKTTSDRRSREDA